MTHATRYIEYSLSDLKFEQGEIAPDCYRLILGGHLIFPAEIAWSDDYGMAWFHVQSVMDDPGMLRVSIGWTHPFAAGRAIFPFVVTPRGPGFWERLRPHLEPYGLAPMLDCEYTSYKVITNRTRRTKAWCEEPYVPHKGPGRPRLDGSKRADGTEYLNTRHSIAPTSLGLVGWGVAVGTGWRFGRR